MVASKVVIPKKPSKDYEKIISALEEEILRKQKKIDELNEQNKILLKTVLRAQNKLGADVKHKE